MTTSTDAGSLLGDGVGLTTAQAMSLLESCGRNQLPRPPRPGVTVRVLHQLRDPMILLLCGALVLVVAVGDAADAVIIAAVVVLNTVIGVVQDLRAARAIDALERMAAPEASVWRDGAWHRLPSDEVVPGDLVRVESGDVVPADLVLRRAVGVEVDEAAMTGESLPVPRAVDDELLAGTVVTRGRGEGLVRRTGADSALGQIAGLVSGRARPTPLQLRLTRLSRQLVALTATVCLVVLVLAVAQGQSWTEAAVLAVSLGVAAVPESLPAVVTISLALGAHRMARHHAVVRRLPAVETLGSVTVIASDKTGTLTRGVLTVQHVWTSDGGCEVSGTGHEVAGELEASGECRASAVRLLRDATLCNDGHLVRDGDTWRPVGDPFDVALLVAAAKTGVTRDSLSGWRRVEETPYDSDLGYAVAVHVAPDGSRVEVVKGAPETVLDLLSAGPVRDRAGAEAARLAATGRRVLAVVEDRSWAGLVAVSDPPHPDAAQVVARCRDAGIRTILVTGDHPATARDVAEQVGILRTGTVVDGDTVARGGHADRVEAIDVYARTRPEQKVAIIDAWQAHGAVVAMTGDGVNDAPALRHADIGVALGGRGTEVARQAADLVLLDDNLETLVAAVAEGRRINANIRTFLRYGLAGGFAEVLVLLGAPFVGLAMPLTPAMILWVNMVTHGLPGVAFGSEPLDPELMRRPPPSPSRRVLDRSLAVQIAVPGVVLAMASLLAGWWSQACESDVGTATFLTLGLGQLFVALALRAPRSRPVWRWRPQERVLELSVLVAGSLQVAGGWAPGLTGLLGTRPLEAPVAVVAAALAVVPAGVVMAMRRCPRWD
jgi:Ca2+-transporting ATPase